MSVTGELTWLSNTPTSTNDILYRLGDNRSDWEKYRISIAQMLEFASIFQIPMVGSDVCGFGGNTTEELCARWATLGAFYPFYRNHNEQGSLPQEFYRWPSVAEAARKAIETRYRLLDYLYTAFHRQTVTGEPFLQPLFYVYPRDPNTFNNDAQFFFGDALLVSPILEPGKTSVNAYLPSEIFYDWHTGKLIRGGGAAELRGFNTTEIPIHIRGGFVLPLRSSGALTTTELRRRGFEILVAPNAENSARGELYLDDGESLHPMHTTKVAFEYHKGKLTIRGDFGPHAEVLIDSVTVLGRQKMNNARRDESVSFDSERGAVTKQVNVKLTGPMVISV